MEDQSQIKPEKIYTISEITRLVKLELEGAFPDLWIEGEISNFHRHHSGHLYFTLKDDKSQLRAVMFRSEAKKIVFDLEDGMQIVCRGRINVYEPRGEYQILVELIEPKGKGALHLAFEQLKEKLMKEGLFDPQKKKKLPILPKKVGVVTSPRGAAIVDILRTLERRFAPIHILIYPVKVQGEGAAEEIVEGIDILSSRKDIDVIIIGRGGGSIEDLWAFNEEAVARAVFRSPVPVISAVGHEIDYTISDFVADIRASTPSAAAEMVIDKEQSFVDKIENLEKSLIHQLQLMVQQKKAEVTDLIRHYAFQNFKDRLFGIIQKVDELERGANQSLQSMQQYMTDCRMKTVLFEERIGSVMQKTLSYLKGKWERYGAELQNLSPLNILKKGYTLCWRKGKKILLQKIDDVTPRDEVTVSFFKGEFLCEVKEVDRKKQIGRKG